MSGPFSLDVDPDQVQDAASQLSALAADLDEQAAHLRGSLPALDASFRGKAARAFETESGHLATQIGGAPPKIEDAIKALRTLAVQYQDAVQVDVARLNQQWQNALDTHTAALATIQRQLAAAPPPAAGSPPALPFAGMSTPQQLAFDQTVNADDALSDTQSQLRAQFDNLRAELRVQTTQAAATISAAVQVAVPAGGASSAAPGAVPGWAWTAMAGALPMTAISHYAQTPPDPTDPAALAKLLAVARGAGMAPTQYKNLLQTYYLSLALQAAGIDWKDWDPARGADALRDIVYKVYTYYGKLFLANPYMQWAGMASMIGPSFASGFFDLSLFKKLAAEIAGGIAPNAPGFGSFSTVANMPASEFAFFETTLLTMQKNIFVDQAPMHEAYLTGGIKAIEEMGAAGLIPPSAVQAWQKIDEGRKGGPNGAALIAQGNTALLHREQFDIIAKDYDRMRAYDGGAFTYVITAVGAPSIPGAHSFGEVFPATLTEEPFGQKDYTVHFPGSSVSFPNPFYVKIQVTTHWPDGNISNRDDRWALISQDTLPAFQKLITEHPDQARAILSTPVPVRVQQQGLEAQWDDILGRLTYLGPSVHG